MPINVSEAKNMADGMPVVGLRATIKAAFEMKSGTSGDREWSFIPLILTDDSGEEIRATWFSPEVGTHKGLKGRPVEITARKTAKNQLAGAKVEHREYQGKAQVQISVNGDHLRFTDEDSEEAASAPQGAPAASGNPAPAPVASSPAKGYQGPQRYNDVELIAAVGRWARGLREALDPKAPEAVPLEVIQPLISTFLIAATSDRSSMSIALPGRLPEPATKPAEKPKPDPEPPSGDPGPSDPGFEDDIPFSFIALLPLAAALVGVVA